LRGIHGWAVFVVSLLSAPAVAQRPESKKTTIESKSPAPAVTARASTSDDEASLEPMVDPATLDPKIPPPDSIIGHAIGADAVRYEPMVRYLKALDDASPLVTLTTYAESHEGRPLYVLTITSEANHAKLDRIKTDNAKLSDPRLLSSAAEANAIVDALPGVAWLAYSIHGDELSSTDAAIQVAYQLAAGTDDQTRRLRDQLVIHIDPLMNPDGRERYLGQLEQLNGKMPNPDFQALQHGGLWSAGRGNHYLFDLNRDWLMQVHPETRGRATAILDWHPHLLVDSHEMGPLDTYLFDPPRDPHNVNLPPHNLAWRRKFSGEQAKALDRYGWSYYTREWYEEWYPGYTNAWANLLGAVGILYEQAGVDGYAVTQATGRLLTYREAVHHHVVSSLTNLESLRANRSELLRDLVEDRKWAVDADRSGKEVLLIRPPTDKPRIERFLDLLSRHRIEYGMASAPFTAREITDVWGSPHDSQEFPAGTLIVRAAQPHRRLLMAMLQFDPHMSTAFLHEERKELENNRGTKVYDTTAWNLCMAYGLDAAWANSIDEPAMSSFAPPGGAWPQKKPAYGYVIDGGGSQIYAALAKLFLSECRVRVASKPFTIQGRDFEPGALLLRNHENGDLEQRIRAATESLGLDVVGMDTALSENGPDLGGQQFPLLVAPRIAIASQWPFMSTSFGAIWHLLDVRTSIRVSPFNAQNIGMMDLRRYNVIVLPDSWSPPALGSILNEATRGKLRSWIEAGGTLIAVGGSAAFIAGKDSGLGSVRLRHDVFDKLAEYDDALKRERSARRVTVNPDAVWGSGKVEATSASSETVPAPDTAAGTKPKPAGESTGSPKDGAAGGKDTEALTREDAWKRLFSPRGAFVRALLNTEHWLCFHASLDRLEPIELPVLIAGSSALVSKPPVNTPARLASAPDLRLSGLLWPEARERWGDTAYATVERVGDGQIILFASDPFFRGYTEGSGRMLLNALFLAPGCGTSQPVPW